MLEAAEDDIDSGVYVLIDVVCRYHGAEPSKGLLGLLMSRKFAVYDYFSDRMIVLKANHYPGRNEHFVNYYWKHFEAEEMMSTPRYGDDVTDEDASNGKARFVSRNAEKNRHVLFGPYHVYPPGEYTTTFYLKVLNVTPGEIALIDVVDAWASKPDKMVILDSRKIDSSHFPDEGEYFPFTLSFSIKENRSLDFRVMFLGNADLYIDRIEVDSPILNF